MATLLLRHADVLVTMDPERREIPDGGLFARDGRIEVVGSTAELPGEADVVYDLRGRVVLPGLINTHHHLYQTLTRAVPAAAAAPLFDWLEVLYPLWARMMPDDLRLATAVGLIELALSGCSTVADHAYVFPGACRLDDTIEAAVAVGVRLHANRGSMSLGRSRGGLPSDEVVEDEKAILADTLRVVDAYHDPEPGAMVTIGVAPCSPFSVTSEAMRDAAELARDKGVRLHTHLMETAEEEAYCLETFGQRPLEHAEALGWTGPDVWFAHGVHASERDIERMVATGTGVAHCPSSNMRLGSGIAPLRRYLDEGVPVGLGVDGSASNDGGHLLGEARQAMLLARLAVAPGVGEAGPQLDARTALELATVGGAAVLGRDDLGSLVPGKVADVAAFDLRRVEYSGAADPVAALVLCAPTPVDLLLVGGRPVVVDGRPVTVDLDDLLVRHRAAAARVVG